jgi:hypothetical protein
MGEQRQRLWERQAGRCAACGRIGDGPESMEAAHLIPQSEWALGKWGANIIHHDLNIRLVCRGRSECNDAVSISNQPRSCDRLAEEIRRVLQEGQDE